MSPKIDPYSTKLHSRINILLLVLAAVIFAIVLRTSAHGQTFSGVQRINSEWENDDWWAQRAGIFFRPFSFSLLATNPILLNQNSQAMLGGPDALTAGSFYWDTSDTGGLQAGSGTWSTTVVDWNTSPTGANSRVVWANPSDAFFETSGTSTVTISGTVTANSVTFNGTGYTIAGGTLTLTGPNITANQNATITAGIGGSVGLTKLGAATLTVDPAFTSYSGTTTISAGILAASSASYFGTSGSTISIGAATLRYDASYTGGLNNISVTTSTSTIDVSGTNSYTPGSISGSGSLTKAGTGTLNINPTNTSYSGSLIINNGIVAASTGDFFGLSGSNITINAGTLRYNASYTGATKNTITVGSATSTIDVSPTFTYAPGVINGSGSLTKAGTGTLNLDFTNTFIGGFTANAGTTNLDVNGALGSVSSVTVNTGATVQSGFLNLTNAINDAAAVTLSGTGILDLRGGTETVGSLAGTSGSLLIGDFGATAGSFTVGNSSSTTFGGVIGGTRATAGAIFTKQGTGTLTLTGANTYSTGDTTIATNGGTLEIANNSSTTAGRIASTGRITVNSGGTLLLSGAGTADRINNAAPVTLAGGTFRLAGGVSEGTTAAAGIGVGALTLSSSSIIDLVGTNPSLHFAASNTQTWTGTLSIYNWNGTPVTGNGPEQIAFGSDTSGLTAAQLNQVSFYSDSGTTFLGTAIFAPDGDGELVPVPEPSTWLAAALALGAVACTQRRRFCTLVRPPAAA